MTCCYLFVLACSSFAVIYGTEPQSIPVEQLSNSDIGWDEFLKTIQPSMSDRALATFRQLKPTDVPKLMEMLGDRDRFVAAHVFLAEVYRADLTLSAKRFHGLDVTLKDDGTSVYPNFDASKLKAYWNDIAKTHHENATKFFAEQKK